MATRYRWTLLRAGRFRLDGGSMFGLVPRSVWTRAVTPDERGRIEVEHNCLLLERVESTLTEGEAKRFRDSPRLVLIEAGTGDKLDAKSRDIFQLADRSIEDALREVNCDPKDVGAVVVTHLHFDHAGGLTRLVREGEKADWTGPASCFSGSRGEHGVKVTFPNAVVYAQEREWSDAMANRSVMTRTYFADHLEPMRERMRLVDSARPFVSGVTPDREEMPMGSWEGRRTEVMPGVFVFLAPGHTWGQQAVCFESDTGETVVFTPDVMPTVHHVGAAYSLGYDVEPYTSMVTRHWFLKEASERGWVLCLDHEPGVPLVRVRENGRGWFELVGIR